MRCFFALDPEPDVRAALADLARRVPGTRVRPTPPANLHMTLAFVGEIDEDAYEALAAGAAAIEHPAFQMTLNRVGFVPRAEIAWIGPSAASAPLHELAQRLGRLLEDVGIGHERQPYWPHVTLARKAGGRPRGKTTEIEWYVRQFTLFRSELSRNGAHHMPLAHFPLAVAG